MLILGRLLQDSHGMFYPKFLFKKGLFGRNLEKISYLVIKIL